MAPKTRLLTLKLDEETLAEFAAAASIKRARSMSAHLHNFVVAEINEARQMVTSSEFQKLVDEHRKATDERSKFRADLAKRGKVAATITPNNEQSLRDEVTKDIQGIPVPTTGKKIRMGNVQQPQSKQRKAR